MDPDGLKTFGSGGSGFGTLEKNLKRNKAILKLSNFQLSKLPSEVEKNL
jgi:hypothetical protein